MTARTVLLVEDNPDDALLSKLALETTTFVDDIVIASDGEEALDYLLGQGTYTSPPPLPNLVLLDLKLPKVDGLEVLKTIRAHPRTKLLTVAILSNSAEERDVTACYAAGANSYLRKPVDYNKFQEMAAQLGNYWLNINIPPNYKTRR